MTDDRTNHELALGAEAASGKVFSSYASGIRSDPAPKSCVVVDFGFISYTDAHQLQRRLVAARKADAIEDVLVLCEHPHVITLGRNAKRENLLASERVLQQKNVELHSTDRGGDITYHGPGQVVVYPILNLAAFRRDVGWYVRMLEETMIRTTADFGIAAEREPGKTGVWVSDGSRKSQAEKLGAIGVHLSRWVTSHGFAYNVSTDLRYFDLIIPCGIADRQATSLEKLTGRAVNKGQVAASLVKHLTEVFGLSAISTTSTELLDRLQRIESSAHEHQTTAVSA